MERIKVDFSDLKKELDNMFNFDELIEASRTRRKKLLVRESVVINSCGECDHVSHGNGSFCEHPDLKKDDKFRGRILAYYGAIPKWCPLDDAKSQKDEDD